MQINILMAFDDNYLEPAITCLNSLFLHNNDCTVWYLYHSVSDDTLSRLKTFSDSKHQKFMPIFVNNDKFIELKTRLHYTIEMYYRLFCVEYLPSYLDKILYLDPDIIVKGDLSEFYNTSFANDTCFIGCEDFDSEFQIKRLEFSNADKYICSGVLLINITKYRDIYDFEKIYTFCVENKPRLRYPDQDVLNALFYKNIQYTDRYKYNYMVNELQSKDITKAAIDNACIIHFASQPKPWLKTYDRNKKVRDIYCSYIDKKYCPKIWAVISNDRVAFIFRRAQRICLGLCKKAACHLLPKKIFKSITKS